MKALVLKTVLDIALGAITAWCVFNICEHKNKIRERNLDFKEKELLLKEKELYLKEREMATKDVDAQAKIVQNMLGGFTKKGVMM